MSQIWTILKWEYMNRVKTKLFLITTFGLPFFMAGMMYLPTILMDLEPEDVTEIGLVYDESVYSLIDRFQSQMDSNYRLKDGNPQFVYPGINIGYRAGQLFQFVLKQYQDLSKFKPHLEPSCD